MEHCARVLQLRCKLVATMNDFTNIASRHADSAAEHGTRDPFAGLEAGRGATRQLAGLAANLRYETLPTALVELIKQCVLDTLGVIIGASGIAPEGRIV